MLFCPLSVVVYNAPFHLCCQIKSIANLDYSPAASPNSYFTGLPLLIQPSELCIIHPQHVVDMKCRNAFGSIFNNSCSEEREQNAEWEAALKCKGKQLNQLSDLLSFSRLEAQFAGCFTTL